MQPRIIILSAVLGMASLVGNAGAQDPPAKPAKSSDGKSDLTEGLMDLLREPHKEPLPKLPNSQTNRQPGQPDSQPNNSLNSQPQTSNSNDAKPDGEDIGQEPANPLGEVQLGMSTLANWMRGQRDVSRTKELQRDVVLRLDEMIGQLEKQSQSQSQSQSSSSPSSSSQSSPSQSASSQSASSSSSSPSSSSQPTSAQGSTSPGQPPGGNRKLPSNSQSPGDAAQQPGNANAPSDAGSKDAQSAPGQNSSRPGSANGGDPQAGPSQPGVSPMRSRSVDVDLNDPRALQRSAWGNLPERMREQMQSRMVERFLPPYRDEIEAYYRALVK